MTGTVNGDPFKEEPMTAALHLPDRQDWTVDDLASLPEEARYELVGGELIPLDPTALHQLIVIRAVEALRGGCPEDLLAVPGIPLAVDRHNEPRPDAVLIRLDHVDRSPVPVGGRWTCPR